MKTYILIKDSIDLGHAILAAAHAGAAILTTWLEDEQVNEWVETSFRKVVCIVSATEFEEFKKRLEDEPIMDRRVMTESGLDNQEVAMVFKPRKDWPKRFKFLKLYK